MGRKLNWKPSPKDNRDFEFQEEHFAMATRLPSKVDLSSAMSPVQDQGQLGCCVGESSNAAVEFIERQYGVNKNFRGSVLFAYYNARADKVRDTGAFIRDSVKAMAQLGLASRHDWPFVPERFSLKPSKRAYKNALTNKITVYSRAKTLRQIRMALAAHHPVLLGFNCYESLESEETARTGIVPCPVLGIDQQIGGHAICLVGYDDSTRLLKFKNSWGTDWGDHGYGYLPFWYVENNQADDFWVVQK